MLKLTNKINKSNTTVGQSAVNLICNSIVVKRHGYNNKFSAHQCNEVHTAT